MSQTSYTRRFRTLTQPRPYAAIGLIVFSGFQVISCAVISAFEFANREMGALVYGLGLLYETGGSMRAWIGMSVATDTFYRANFDTLIMGGGTTHLGSRTGMVVAEELKLYQRGFGA